MYIDKSWSFSEAILKINSSFEPGSQFSGKARNVSIENWAQLVGKNKAQTELQAALDECGAKKAFYQKYQMASTTLDGLFDFISKLPDQQSADNKSHASKYEKVDRAFNFLVGKERSSETFTIKELAEATDWTVETCRTYPIKRWHQYVDKVGKDYSSSGFAYMSLDEFRAVHSQKLQQTSDLSSRGILLEKAKEFALLAVSTYNNPFTHYKTYGFIVNIVIAYTSLFHAIYEKKGLDYRHLDSFGNPVMVDGEAKAWELSKCCRHYWQNTGAAEVANIEFLVGLRNKIEHRSLPALDLAVAGECQSALSNFENLLIKEFGDSHTLCANLAIAIQLTRISEQAQIDAIKQLQRENYRIVREYMETFRNDLDEDVFQSQHFRLRAFLVPKIGNHAKSSDLAIEFVNVEKLNSEQLGNYERGIAFIKGVESPYKLKPGKVVALLNDSFPEFNMAMHTKCWKYFTARPQNIEISFKGEYAAYVEGFDHYLYTKKWVGYLKTVMADKVLIEKIKKS